MCVQGVAGIAVRRDDGNPFSQKVKHRNVLAAVGGVDDFDCGEIPSGGSGRVVAPRIPDIGADDVIFPGDNPGAIVPLFTKFETLIRPSPLAVPLLVNVVPESVPRMVTSPAVLTHSHESVVPKGIVTGPEKSVGEKPALLPHCLPIVVPLLMSKAELNTAPKSPFTVRATFPSV